jgi:osmoprotectant transport system permease protein
VDGGEGRAVTFLEDLFVWLNDPANWRGSGGLAARTVEHLVLSLGSLLLAAAVAVPAGALLGRSRLRGTTLVNVANIGRAVPSFAVLVLGVIWLGLGSTPTVVTLVLLAVPPVFVLTFTAVRQVDPAVVESARGMGMTEGRVLRTVQLPVARPLILDGLRLASAAVIATATMSALIGGGGLGRLIIDGFSVRDFRKVVAGTLAVVVLVVASEAVFSTLARVAVSPGLRPTRRARGRRRDRGLRADDIAGGLTSPDSGVPGSGVAAR